MEIAMPTSGCKIKSTYPKCCPTHKAAIRESAQLNPISYCIENTGGIYFSRVGYHTQTNTHMHTHTHTVKLSGGMYIMASK